MTDPETISQAQAADAEAARRAEHMQKARQPFPLLQGSFFYFTIGGLLAVDKFVDGVEPGWPKTYGSPFGVMEKLLLAGRADAVRVAIDAGLKHEVDGKVEPVDSIDLDAVDWPIPEIVEPALNALAFRYTGRTYRELITEATAAAEARASDARKAWEDRKAAT